MQLWREGGSAVALVGSGSRNFGVRVVAQLRTSVAWRSPSGCGGAPWRSSEPLALGKGGVEAGFRCVGEGPLRGKLREGKRVKTSDVAVVVAQCVG